MPSTVTSHNVGSVNLTKLLRVPNLKRAEGEKERESCKQNPWIMSVKV